ncbi:MAG: SWIB/MDM2 domain-containing protein [Bacteroidia bacterium]
MATTKKAVKKSPAKKSATKKSATKSASKKTASKTGAAKKSASKKTVKKTTGAKKTAKKSPAKKKSARKPNAAFMAPLTPSPQLAAVIGNKPMARTEMVKKIWDYIKANKLQDSKNKRMINTDGKLKEVFNGKKQVSMFEVAGAINKNVKK